MFMTNKMSFLLYLMKHLILLLMALLSLQEFACFSKSILPTYAIFKRYIKKHSKAHGTTESIFVKLNSFENN